MTIHTRTSANLSLSLSLSLSLVCVCVCFRPLDEYRAIAVQLDTVVDMVQQLGHSQV